MLTNFFQLNSPYGKFNETQLVDHLNVSNDLRSVLYEPDKWPSRLNKVADRHFLNVSLAKTSFQRVTFTSCKFEDCLFIGSSFLEVEFHQCKFVNCNFHKIKFINCYIDPDCIHFDKIYRKRASNIGIHIYQQLFENSNSSGQMDFKIKADFEFKRWKRWQLTYDKKLGHINTGTFIVKKFFSLCDEWMTGFGYKPWRFAVFTIIVFTIVSWINMNVLSNSMKYNGIVVNRISFSDSIFYTYSMMTSLGFSTIEPETAGAKILAVLEALVGIGWLGIFISLLVKRFIK